MKIFLFLIFGFLGGIMGGMGLGGGTLLIPLLTNFANVEQITSQGINLLCFLPMALVSLFFHIKNGFVNFKSAAMLIPTGIIGAICGSMLTKVIEQKNLKLIFGCFLIILGAINIFAMFINKKQNQQDKT